MPVTELTSHDLLALLPIGTAAVLALRLIVGVRTIGSFAPALLALTVYQLGVSAVLAMLLVAGASGLLASPLIDRLSLPKASRLAMLVVVSCAALVATGVISGDAVAFPLVVMAIVIERTWEAARIDGVAAGVRLSAATVAVAIGTAALLAVVAPVLDGRHWAPIAALGLTVNLAVGSYRGLRLTERRRFAQLIARRDVTVAA